MEKYYEIPQNCTYEQFAKLYIQLNLYTSKYVRQFSMLEKTILYVGDEEIIYPEKGICITTFQASELKIVQRQSSSVCCSIRISDLLLSERPYECIAKKINNFPYILCDAVLHTDQYGVQRLIFI